MSCLLFSACHTFFVVCCSLLVDLCSFFVVCLSCVLLVVSKLFVVASCSYVFVVLALSVCCRLFFVRFELVVDCW